MGGHRRNRRGYGEHRCCQDVSVFLWMSFVLAGRSGDNPWYIALIPFRCVHSQRKGGIVSVQGRLGLGPEMEFVIADAWEGWVEKQPRLAAVTEPRRLQAWRREADPQLSDEVVHGLAWLASIEGGDDHEAARALAWLLLPGACFVARQLRTLTPSIDDIVASELWILVRTFPLRRRKVVVNLMRDLRSRVLHVCETPATVRVSDPTRLAIVGSVDSESVWSVPADNRASELEELVDVLDWAYEERVIGAEDRRLLLCLVEAAEGASTRVGGPGHGLLSNEATERVGRRLGVCERTVRRRAMRSIEALTAAAPAYTRVA